MKSTKKPSNSKLKTLKEIDQKEEYKDENIANLDEKEESSEEEPQNENKKEKTINNNNQKEVENTALFLKDIHINKS